MANKKRDLIDRGQIQYTWWELPGGKYTDGVTLQSLIHLMPTVDAVEVVRCKDCIHFKETSGKDSGKPCGYGRCMKPFFIQMIVDAEDFCSYGERKDND